MKPNEYQLEKNYKEARETFANSVKRAKNISQNSAGIYTRL